MNIWHIAWMIVKRTLGSRKGILLLVVLPAVVISGIIGLFGKSAMEPARITVVNADNGPFGSRLQSVVQASPAFRLQSADDATPADMKKAVADGQTDAALFIPADFSERLLAGGRPAAELYRKSVQTWNAALALDLQSETSRLWKTAALAAAQHQHNPETKLTELLDLQNALGVKTENKALPYPASGSITMVIGVMVMFLMYLSNQAVYGVMEDRASGTMARTFSAPVRAWEIAAGNFFGCVVTGTIQIALIITLARLVSGSDFGLSSGKLFIIMECFLLAALGIASALAGAVGSNVSLAMVNNLVVVPSCMLGGCFWPVGLMPDFMQKLSLFMPQHWAIRAVETAGAGESIGLPIGILVLFAAVLLAFGAYILQPAQRSL